MASANMARYSGEKTIAGLPKILATLKLHCTMSSLRHWGKTLISCIKEFSTLTSINTEDAVALFSQYGLNTVFENTEDFPEDWKTNAPAFVRFVVNINARAFWEYGEYPMSPQMRSKGIETQGGFFRNARSDAVAVLRCLQSSGSKLTNLEECYLRRHMRLEIEDIQHFLVSRPCSLQRDMNF